MSGFCSSLYGRISAIFLVLLLVLSLVQLLVGVETARNFSRESDQSLNQHLAADLARTFQPDLAEGLNAEAIRRHIHDLMIFNPRVEIYLLDAEGRILAYFSGGEPLAQQRVDVGPIRAFLAEPGPPLPIYGDDPRSAGKRKPFSVAPLRIGESPGYLYLILGGESYETIASMVEDSYIVRNGIISLLASFLLIGIVGLVIFFLLTKRLRRMASAVRAIEEGHYGMRLPERPHDEIGNLAKAFNDMAARVERNVEEIRRSDALRRELVANVSHDLRSPLSSVQGYLETVLMKEERLSPGGRRRFLEIIYNNVLRLSTLVGELFELSRLEARQIEPVREPFSLAELVQDVVVKLQPQALEQRIDLRTEYPHDLPFVAGDIGMIERALVNLIDNALRYTPAQGRVTVSLAPAGGAVRVRVSDTGPGIPAEDVPRIFERLYRVDRSRARHSGGSGMGLAIVRQILEHHQSEIRVEQTSPAGTVFAFDLATHAPGDGEPGNPA